MAPTHPSRPGNSRLVTKKSVDLLVARDRWSEDKHDKTSSEESAALLQPHHPSTVAPKHVSDGTAPTSTGSTAMSAMGSTESFFKRLFISGTEREKEKSNPTKDGSSAAVAEAIGALGIIPSPHTRPLLTKPKPRDESALNSFKGMRGRTLIGQEMDEYDAMSHGQTSGSSFRTIQSSSEASDDWEDDMHGSSSRPSLDVTAAHMAGDRFSPTVVPATSYMKDWEMYMKYYTEGRFNISNPPDPPAHRPDFPYLKAPMPLNESARYRSYEKMSFELPGYADKAAQHLVALAVRVFQTPTAALSFFDHRDEVMRAENGFGLETIPRADSIGAHALLSGGEPMIIFDTHKDWRFKGHPFVQGPPYIRFLAATPLVCPEGYTLGVLVVFDPKPRADISTLHRRMLSGFTRMAMTDLELVVAAHEAELAAAGLGQAFPMQVQGPRAGISTARMRRDEAELEETLNEITAVLSRTTTEEIHKINVNRRPPAVPHPDEQHTGQVKPPTIPLKSPDRIVRARTNTAVRVDCPDWTQGKGPLHIETQPRTRRDPTIPTPPDTPLSTGSSPQTPSNVNKALPCLPTDEAHIHPALRTSPLKFTQSPEPVTSSSPAMPASKKARYMTEEESFDAFMKAAMADDSDLSPVQPFERLAGPGLTPIRSLEGLEQYQQHPYHKAPAQMPSALMQTLPTNAAPGPNPYLNRMLQASPARHDLPGMSPRGHGGRSQLPAVPRLIPVHSFESAAAARTPKSSTANRPPQRHPQELVATPQALPFPRALDEPHPLAPATLAQAHYVLGLVCRRIKHDVVYALRVTPNVPYAHALAGGPHAGRSRRATSWSTHVLVAYGVSNPAPSCATEVHLRVLRSGVGLIYSNSYGGTQRGAAWRSGCVTSVYRDPDPRQNALTARRPDPVDSLQALAQPMPACEGGVVLASFSRNALPADTKKVRALMNSGAIMLRDTLAKDGIW